MNADPHIPDIQKDLEATVGELSHTYEELSLLYRLSEVLSGMGADEIAEQVVDETINTLDVKTAALLFFDQDKRRLFTKSSRGGWERDTVITEDDALIWDAVMRQRPVAFCDLRMAGHRGYAYAERSLFVCPLKGKTRALGAIVLADKGGTGEFYSNDIKLVMAIADHAALIIENALLYKELEEFLLSAIRSLVKALEASSYWTAGHTERVTEYAIGIGSIMGLSGKQLERLRICALLHDIGKIATPKHILDKADILDVEEMMEVKRHPLIGAEILGGFTQLQDVILGIKYHHESWDGHSSLLGLRGEQVPLMARILSVADSFDAMTSDRPYRKKKTKDDSIQEILSLSGKQYDPKVVEAFSQWISQQYPAFLP